MNPGHRRDVGSNIYITFSKDSPSKDAIVMGTFSRDTFNKTNSGMRTRTHSRAVLSQAPI